MYKLHYYISISTGLLSTNNYGIKNVTFQSDIAYFTTIPAARITKCDIQGRIYHSGAPHQRNAGALFSYARSQDFLWACSFFSSALFFSQKVDLFSRRRYV